MKIIFNYLDVQRYHKDVLAIIGVDHSHSSRSVSRNYVEFFTTQDLTQQQQDALADLAISSSSELLIE